MASALTPPYPVLRLPARAALVALAALALAACGSVRPPASPGAPAGVQALPGYRYLVSDPAEADARRDLSTLAADDMGGREAGTPDERAAAAYITARLQSLGVQPGGDLDDGERSYLQAVPLETARFADGARIALDGGLALTPGDDWIAFPQSTADVSLDAPLVFVGYGLTAPGHDDYADLDVAGKVVLVAPGQPAGLDSVATPQGPQPAGAFLPKYIGALQRGAAAVLAVASPNGSLVENWTGYRAIALGTSMAPEGTPVQTSPAPFAFVHPDAAGRLLAALGAPATVIDDAEASRPVAPFDPGRAAQVELAVERGATTAHNIVGVVPGDTTPDEFVALGAHYDHVGTIAGEVYNGADDDASGVTALLAVAQALAADRDAGDAPDRSALFVFHTAEEKGLHGSEFFAANPDRSAVGDLSRVVAQVNIDMVGREHPDSLYVVGASRLSSEYGRRVEAVNQALGEGGRPLFGFDRSFDDPDDPENIYGRSDHYNYAKRGVPVVFFFDGMGANWRKGGPDDTYHQPSDDVHLIDFDKLLRAARLTYGVVRATADAPERPTLDTPDDRAAAGSPASDPHALLDAALDAHGGRDRILALDAVAFRHEATAPVPGQGAHVGEPASAGVASAYLLDLDGRRARTDRQFDFPGGYRFLTRTVEGPDGGTSFDLHRVRSGSDASPVPAADAPARWASHARALAPLALRWAALEADSLVYDGRTDRDGRPHDAVTAVGPDGVPVTFYLDAEDHHLAALDVVREAGTTTTEYGGGVRVEGVLVPETVTVRQGPAGLPYRVTAVEIDPNVGGQFEVPNDLTTASERAPEAVRLADRVYLLDGLPGDFRALAAVQDDHVVLIEAPSPAPAVADATTQALRALLEAVAPGMPVRHVVVTHHHVDHVGALESVIEGGAVPVVGPNGDALVRALVPGGDPAVEVVSDRRTLGAGPGRVDLYTVQTGHAETMLMAYLPAADVLFQGDLFLLPHRGDPTVSFEVYNDFARALAERGLEPARIVSAHGGRDATLDDLRRVLARPLPSR